MSKVQAATNSSGEELKQLKTAAEQAGLAGKVSSVAAANALENLAKAGLNGKEAIQALPAVMSMASAGGVDLADAAEKLTGVVMGMGMGLQFSESGRVADVLAKGANISRTSITGLAEAMSYAAPIAKTVGLSLESTVAIVGQFSNAGIDASRAGTALNSVLAQFSDSSSKFRQELSALGVSTNNFDDALKQLAAAGPKGAAAIRAVGTEAGPAMMAALNLGIPALAKLRKQLDESKGSAEATAEIMKNNLNGAIDDLSATWEAVRHVLGAPVLPVLKSGIDELAGALRAAVENGTIAAFSTALAKAFESAIAWVRAFAAEVDFTQLSVDLQGFAARTGEAFDQIGKYATNAGDIVKLSYGAMSAGVNAVLVPIYGIGEAFAGVARDIMLGVATIRDGLAKITIGKLGESFKQAAKTREIDAALASLSTTLPAVSAEQKKKAESDATAAAAAEQHRAAIAQLRAEYAALVVSGDWQGAVEKQQELNAALRATGPAAQDAAQAAKALADAYTNLGVTSSTALTNLASKAKSDFELIKSSGTASAADIGAAFAAATEKAIAANNGIAPSWVKAEAAARGYKIEIDAAGKETLKLVNASQGAAQALKTLGIDADAVSTKISSGFKESADAVTSLQNNFSALESQGVKATEAITLGLNKMLGEAKNQADLDALKRKVEELRGVLGNTVANGFLEQAAKKADELKAAMDAATPGINSAAEAFKELGITSDKELKQTAATAKEAFDAIKASGTASPREISEAWKAMAEASIAANDGVADASITSGAAAQGFAIEVDKAGKASVKALGEVKEGFEKVDYAAQMAGKSVEELQSIKSQGWGIAEDMKEAADIQNAATNALTNAWRLAAVEADKYYSELYKIYKMDSEFVAKGPWEMEKALWAASAAMKELDKQQQAIERSGNDAASGLAGLQDRLLALSGSEEEVAAARYARDQAEVRQKMALLQLDIQRAQIRKNDEEATLLHKELDTYQQQLTLLEQIYRKEKSQREEKTRAEKEAERQRKAEQAARDAADKKARQERDESTKKEARLKERGGSGSGGGSMSITPAPINITLNANGINDPVKLARLMEPELKKIAALAR